MYADSPTRNGPAVHVIHSEYQSEPTTVRVLVPNDAGRAGPYPVVYVLPVEARDGQRFGDGMRAVLEKDLHNSCRAVFAEPTFSRLPWYVDHPTDPAIRQESYLLRAVVPLVEEHYPVRADRDGRLLLGFSKSGWGAFSLLLRHPKVFAKAAAWDAPLMMDYPGPYGSEDVFGSAASFEGYRITRLLKEAAGALGDAARLILLGYGGFRGDHVAAHRLMEELRIPHVYRDGPRRAHHWHSGWVAEAAQLLLDGCADVDRGGRPPVETSDHRTA